MLHIDPFTPNSIQTLEKLCFSIQCVSHSRLTPGPDGHLLQTVRASLQQAELLALLVHRVGSEGLTCDEQGSQHRQSCHLQCLLVGTPETANGKNYDLSLTSVPPRIVMSYLDNIS